MADSDLSRKGRERLRHRNEILAAAERVFVRDGYNGTTVERIAQEADFAVGTLYNFFENKQKLFEEVTTKIVEEAFALLEKEVFAEPDPMKALKALIKVRLRYPQEHQGFARVFLEVVPGGLDDLSHSLPESCRELFQRYIESVERVIERGISIGVFRRADPVYIALCLEGAFEIVGGYWVRDELPGPLPERIEKVEAILLAMVSKDETNSREGTSQ